MYYNFITFVFETGFKVFFRVSFFSVSSSVSEFVGFVKYDFWWFGCYCGRALDWFRCHKAEKCTVKEKSIWPKINVTRSLLHIIIHFL